MSESQKEWEEKQMVANFRHAQKFICAINQLCCILGSYSCLRVELTFARQLSFFIVTIYVPCFMIVGVSWMSFWIDHKAVRKSLRSLDAENEEKTSFSAAAAENRKSNVVG